MWPETAPRRPDPRLAALAAERAADPDGWRALPTEDRRLLLRKLERAAESEVASDAALWFRWERRLIEGLAYAMALRIEGGE